MNKLLGSEGFLEGELQASVLHLYFCLKRRYQYSIFCHKLQEVTTMLIRQCQVFCMYYLLNMKVNIHLKWKTKSQQSKKTDTDRKIPSVSGKVIFLNDKL